MAYLDHPADCECGHCMDLYKAAAYGYATASFEEESLEQELQTSVRRHPFDRAQILRREVGERLRPHRNQDNR